MTPQESLGQLLNRIIYLSAVSMVRSGDLGEAERFLQLTPEPVPAQHLVLLGKVYAQQRRYEKAIAEWRRALEAAPDNPEAADAIKKAEELIRDPSAHPARVWGRRLLLAGQLVLVIALVVSIYSNSNLRRRGDALEADLLQARSLLAEQARTRQQEKEDSLRAQQLSEVRNRLRAEKRLDGFEVSVRRDGERVWCSGKVPSLYLKDLASATARSVGGVQSVDTLALEVTHSYATRPGDILSRVAVRVYGDATRWRQIRSANKEKIENPDALSPGVVLTIP